jgi:hypothetical protein
LTPLRQPLPEKGEAAALAATLTDGKAVDVALLAAGRPQAVIRIEVSRQPRRAGPLPTSPLPLIVLDAQAVIEQATRWTPRADGFRPMTCPACRPAYRRFQQAARQVAAETGIALPEIYYRYAIHPCWRCDQRMLVFAWPGGRMFSQAKPQHHPLPQTIQYRSSRMAGARYWVNTCPHCRAIQGDFFLHGEMDGPLAVMELCDEDTPPAFQRDLIRIARQNSRFNAP